MTQEKEKLVIDNMALATFTARKFFGSIIENEDIISTAQLGLVKAALHFDASKGYSFSTFAVKVITNEILLMFRNEKKQERLNLISIETPMAVVEGLVIADVIPDTKNDFVGAENRLCFVQNLSELDEKEQNVLLFKVKNPDFSQEQVAQAMNHSQSYISRIMRNIREKVLER